MGPYDDSTYGLTEASKELFVRLQNVLVSAGQEFMVAAMAENNDSFLTANNKLTESTKTIGTDIEALCHSIMTIYSDEEELTVDNFKPFSKAAARAIKMTKRLNDKGIYEITYEDVDSGATYIIDEYGNNVGVASSDSTNEQFAKIARQLWSEGYNREYFVRHEDELKDYSYTMKQYQEGDFQEKFTEAATLFAKEMYPDSEKPYDSLIQAQRCAKNDIIIGHQVAVSEGINPSANNISDAKKYWERVADFCGFTEYHALDLVAKSTVDLHLANINGRSSSEIKEKLTQELKEVGEFGLFSKTSPVLSYYLSDLNVAVRKHLKYIGEDENWAKFEDDKDEELGVAALTKEQIDDYSNQYAETLRQAGWSGEQIAEALASFNSKLTGNPKNDDEHTNN